MTDQKFESMPKKAVSWEGVVSLVTAMAVAPVVKQALNGLVGKQPSLYGKITTYVGVGILSMYVSTKAEKYVVANIKWAQYQITEAVSDYKATVTSINKEN